jgi:hypothetical protein
MKQHKVQSYLESEDDSRGCYKESLASASSAMKKEDFA